MARSKRRARAAALAAGLSLLGGGPALAETAAQIAGSFEAPETVVLQGYDDHAMEPFLTRDGRWLLFNNRNQPEDATDLHAAERLDDLTFVYRGPLRGANSEALDGVPSVDRDGWFYFVSPRAYDETRNTLWTGVFEAGEARGARPLAGDVSRARPLWLNIDLEISADGRTLYFAENRWRLFFGGVSSSNLLAARRQADGRFLRLPNAEAMFAAINTDLLEFAPATTPDELTLYFTRVDRDALAEGAAAGFGIYVATRAASDAPFGTPARIARLAGYVEAPSVSPDGCALYFHQRLGARFVIRRTARAGCAPE